MPSLPIALKTQSFLRLRYLKEHNYKDCIYNLWLPIALKTLPLLRLRYLKDYKLYNDCIYNLRLPVALKTLPLLRLRHLKDYNYKDCIYNLWLPIALKTLPLLLLLYLRDYKYKDCIYNLCYLSHSKIITTKIVFITFGYVWHSKHCRSYAFVTSNTKSVFTIFGYLSPLKTLPLLRPRCCFGKSAALIATGTFTISSR